MNTHMTTPRMTAKDFPQELLDLYDYYAHGKITKREFLDRAGKWAVGGLTAAAILSTMSPNYALAQQVAEDDFERRVPVDEVILRFFPPHLGRLPLDGRER